MPVALVVLLLVAHARTVEVRVPGPAGTLAGTLALPARGRTPFPAVVTVTGSGAHHGDGNRTPEHPYRPFRDIAEALAGCGIATLRLEMVAAEDPTVAAAVLLAGPALPFRETMRYQHRYRIENDPTIPPAKRDAALAEAMRQQEANVATSTEAWRRSIQDRDPLPTARRLRMPVLIRHGLTDRAVAPEDARMLEGAIPWARAKATTGCPPRPSRPRCSPRCVPGYPRRCAEAAAPRRNRTGMIQRSMAIVSTNGRPRRILLTIVAGVIAGGAASAQTPPPLPSVALPAPLARVLTDYEAAWQRKDAAGLAALFTEDGFVLSSGNPPVRGRAPIEKHYAGHGGPLALRALAYATEGSVGYVIGGFARAKGEPDIGKFTLTLRKVGSRWMILSDMDNGNARRQAAQSAPAGPVVFVCEHGSVKSVMAAQWFNRLAAERKLPFRAISRGVAPDDAIPAAVAGNLARDGFDVAGFTPERLANADVVDAVQVVAIGIDSPLFAAAATPVARWNDIPPASTDYERSRDAIRARMGALLDSLASATRR